MAKTNVPPSSTETLLSRDGLASLEYTTDVLETPLIVELGHDACGVIHAAIKVIQGDAKLPGHVLAPLVEEGLIRVVGGNDRLFH